MVQGIHVSRRNSELTDSDSLFITNFNWIVDVDFAIKLEFRVEDNTQKPSLISFPRWGKHSFTDVQEWLFQPGSIREVGPHQANLLCDEEPVCAIVGVHHGHRIAQPVGHLHEAQLETALGIGRHQPQVLVQILVGQQVWEAVVSVFQGQVAAELYHVVFQCNQLWVCRERAKNGAAVLPHLRAVVLAQSWDGPHGGGGILSIIQVSCIWRAFLEGERKSFKSFLGADLKQLSSDTNWRYFILITRYVVVYSEDILRGKDLRKEVCLSTHRNYFQYSWWKLTSSSCYSFILTTELKKKKKPAMMPMSLHHPNRLYWGKRDFSSLDAWLYLWNNKIHYRMEVKSKSYLRRFRHSISTLMIEWEKHQGQSLGHSYLIIW